METSARNLQQAICSSLYIVSMFSTRFLPPTDGRDSIFPWRRWATLRLCAYTVCPYALHISLIFAILGEQYFYFKGKYADSSWIRSESHQDGESKEGQTRRLYASGGTGLQGKSHFMAFSCGGPCKDRSFVSHLTSEKGGSALLLLLLLLLLLPYYWTQYLLG